MPAPGHWERRLSSPPAVGAVGMSTTVEARLNRRRSRTGGIEPPVREAGWKAGAPSLAGSPLTAVDSAGVAYLVAL